ncbi:conserved protein of unknown function [Cupriavidus neocaledonicus]|uniref:Uncharacterized protein n=1 Tax=Cupriavidus neocaledonicus TaxID=1040979 RepID=A0A375GY74_9BURK|nr:hypothetical protein CBM2605_A10020 [Cupriavidus neocaledonicus]SPD45064.1 conserved protein of unknown function [Cupriavidus neocaledonicus]
MCDGTIATLAQAPWCAIVHNSRWVTTSAPRDTSGAAIHRRSPCFAWVFAPFRTPETRMAARVVHINPLHLHKLSTDLSFVDNSGAGVQSGSKHNTGCVAQAQPGLPPRQRMTLRTPVRRAGRLAGGGMACRGALGRGNFIPATVEAVRNARRIRRLWRTRCRPQGGTGYD